MHAWLFERSGQFSDEELKQEAELLGMDWMTFRAAMQADSTQTLITSDAAAANTAGLKFTPLVFINGDPIKLSP